MLQFARIKGLSREEAKFQTESMLKDLKLDAYSDKPAGTYSGGNKRKLAVGCALIGSPKIVFLGIYVFSLLFPLLNLSR